MAFFPCNNNYSKSVIGYYTLSGTGNITIPNSAGASYVTVSIHNYSSGAYVLHVNLLSGTYKNVIQERNFITREGNNTSRGMAIVEPNPDVDLVIVVSTYNGPATTDNVYVIAP